MTDAAYRYRATIDRVIDGDTYVLNVDLGMYVHHVVHVRLRGWSAVELNQPGGIEAKQAAEDVLMVYSPLVVIETYKDQQTLGRWIADIWVNGVPLHELLKDYLHPGGKMGAPRG